MNVGETVETIYGEKAKVLKVEQRSEKKKKGKVIEEGQTYYLLESGPHGTWFPSDKLKGAE